jgi:TonB family protein
MLSCLGLAGLVTFTHAQSANPSSVVTDSEASSSSSMPAGTVLSGDPVKETALHHKLGPEEATALRIEAVPPKYPGTAVKAGIQGAVSLTLTIDTAGSVKDVVVVSGDPALAAAALDAVRQWRYKPLLSDGNALEFETNVTLNFRLKNSPPVQAAPAGIFRNAEYVNEYFGLYYPLSRDWILETQAVRKRASESGVPGTTTLLGAIRVPESSQMLRADSSLALMAWNRSPDGVMQDCKSFLAGLSGSLKTKDEGKQKGEFADFSVAGHSFLRGDFEYRKGSRERAILCEAVKNYLLVWSFAANWKDGVEAGVGTMRGLQTAAPVSVADPVLASKVQLAMGVTQGMLIHKVNPEYPEQARKEHIQGTVVLHAMINKVGDVVDLEVLDGPIELVPSAVVAVRAWKYRPYLLGGQPVDVETQITVNYTLEGR